MYMKLRIVVMFILFACYFHLIYFMIDLWFMIDFILPCELHQLVLVNFMSISSISWLFLSGFIADKTASLSTGLEQEFLSEGGDKGSGERAAKSPPTPSPLVQQILGRGMSKVPCPATPLQSLAPEVRQVVTQLPNLSFMRSRVLMFPIRGDQ